MVATPSLESGADIPSENIYKKTTFGATFDGYCIRRNLILQWESKVLRFANETPFDQIIVLVNSPEYGGQGSSIATFSLNENAPELIFHELGHAIALLADEYRQYSDRKNIKTCEDYYLREYTINLNKNYGCNRFFKKEELLAPNLTLFDDIKKAKWSHLLTINSPVINFDYPLTRPELTEDFIVKTKYLAQDNIEEFLLIFGASLKFNKMASSQLKSLFINDIEYTVGENLKKVVPQDQLPDKAYTFFTIKDLQFEKGENIKVWAQFLQVNKADKKSINYHISGIHGMSLPSKIFNSDKIGLFQGAFPEVSKVYRANYCSYYNSTYCKLNIVQLNAFEAALKSYMKQ